jgi:hypothetical protein
MGKFLELALNRFNTFRGTVGVVNDVEHNTISNDPEQTINMVHSRVTKTFLTAKQGHWTTSSPVEAGLYPRHVPLTL